MTNAVMNPGPAGPPQWLAQFMAAPPQWLAGNINQIQGEMQVGFAEMRAGFAEMRAEMRAGFALIEARHANTRISRLNKLDMDNNTGHIAYRAKQKEVSKRFFITRSHNSSSARLPETVQHSRTTS
jgi:hypothetical protein